MMKLVFILVSVIGFVPFALAQRYCCEFSDGGFVETQFCCDSKMIQTFSKRLVQLYPEVQQLNRTQDFMKNLYVMALVLAKNRLHA